MGNSDKVVGVVLNDKYTFKRQDGKIGEAAMLYYAFDPQYDLHRDKDGIQNLPNSNIIVVINKNLSPAAAAEVYSHEGNGHALLYILNGGNHKGASHDNERSWDLNRQLIEMIINSKQELLKICKNNENNNLCLLFGFYLL